MQPLRLRRAPTAAPAPAVRHDVPDGRLRHLDRMRFVVAGLAGRSDARRLERRLARLDGVETAVVRFEDGNAMVAVLDQRLSADDVCFAVRASGFYASVIEEQQRTPRDIRNERHDALWRAAWLTVLPTLAVLALGLVDISVGDRAEWLRSLLTNGQLLLCALVFWLGSGLFDAVLDGPETAERARRELPLALAAIAAMSASIWLFLTSRDPHFSLCAAIVATHHTGAWLESWLLRRAERHFERLQELRPRQAVVRRDGCDYQIAIRDLLAEDLVVVQAGEVVPVDGTLHESGGRVDEALILGEGSAEQKAVGGPVFAGSRNVGETFVVKTSRRGADTVLGHMLGVVEAARRVRANAQVRGDRLAQRALPIAGAAAFVTFAVWQVRLGDAAVWEALSPALAVLITLTPRALAFASVSALTSGMTSAARLGVLLRDARAIEAIRDLDLMVFEKAGTLTVGRPEVESFEAFGLSAKRALTLLAAVEQRSEHAFAEAITRYASEELAGAATERPEVRSFRTVPGRGVIARVEEHEVVVGSAALLVDKGVAFPEDIIQTVGGSWLFMAVDGRFRARAHLFDPLRQDAVEAVRAATDAGVRPMLVTASAQEEALQVALAVGIAPHDVRSGMDAAEHGEVVRVLKASDRTVGVVGTSGFSSAALSQAHAAIVLRGDASLRDAEYAAILLRPGTGGVRMTLQIAHRTFGAVRQNLLASTVAMGLAVPAGMGMLPPGWALAALLATTVGVGLNGPRLDPGAVGPPVRPVPKA